MTPQIRQRKLLRRACLAAVVVLLLPAAHAYAVPTWTRVASPNRGTVASVLQDVATVPGTDTAWAVGYYYDSATATFRTMTQRYNGTSWGIVPSPNGTSGGYSQLTGVDATSATNAWAIGGGLVARWNGTAWSRLSLPAIALRGIDVVSSTEAWAAGYSGSQAAVAQYRNGTWTTRYTLPVPAGRHLSVFEAVAVDAAGQVWAVGWDRDYDAPGRPVSSLVVHFDGTSWTREATPNPQDRNTLEDVTVLGNGDVLTVGIAQDVSGSGITQSALVLRRHAGAWAALPPPAGDAQSGQLQSVAAVSDTNVWMVGYYLDETSGPYQPLLMRWVSGTGNGTLTTYDVSPPLTAPSTAWGVAATATGRLWAVGYQSTSGGDRTLILRGTAS